VLADGQTEDRGRVREMEPVAGKQSQIPSAPSRRTQGVGLHGDIVGDDRLLLELKLLEGIGLEDLLRLWMQSRIWSAVSRDKA
jgi:hypothetical protein